MRFRIITLTVLLCVLASGAPGKTPAARLLIRDVRVFDGERVLEHRSVLVENGKINLIGGPKLKALGAEVINGQGRTLLPGFFDAHVHLPTDADVALRQTLLFGVTTVLDMFTSPDTLKELKKIKAEDSPDIADVRTAGIGASVPGGHPSQMGGPPIPTLTGSDQAQAFVDARIAEGSDYIKIIYDDLSWAMGADRRLPMLDKETLEALVKAAHQRSKLAVVHIHSEQQARDAIAAGADGLVHLLTMEKTASSHFGQFAASRRVFVIPTLSTLYAACGISSGPAVLADPHLQPYIGAAWRGRLTIAWPLNKPSCEALKQGMSEIIRSKVPILSGTDAPVPGATYGASLHGELALLVEAGLNPVQALATATSIPARCFQLSDRGLIRPGMRADLVLVEGDPTRNILATRNIVAVFKRGIRVQR